MREASMQVHRPHGSRACQKSVNLLSAGACTKVGAENIDVDRPSWVFGETARPGESIVLETSLATVEEAEPEADVIVAGDGKHGNTLSQIPRYRLAHLDANPHVEGFRGLLADYYPRRGMRKHIDIQALEGG